MATLRALLRTGILISVYIFFGVLGLGCAGLRIFSHKAYLRAAAYFTRQWGRCSCFIFNIHPRWLGEGSIPSGSLIVANHFGTPDIFVLSSGFEAFFVSKAEIASWPFVSWLTRLGGTIFVDRTRRYEVKSTIAQIQRRLEDGESVILFPESTATDGTGVIPFKSSHFEAAVRSKAPVVPVALVYHDPARPSVAGWGNITFWTHITRLLKNPRLDVTVHVFAPIAPAGDRRWLAGESQRKIGEKFRHLKSVPGPRRDDGVS